VVHSRRHFCPSPSPIVPFFFSSSNDFPFSFTFFDFLAVLERTSCQLLLSKDPGSFSGRSWRPFCCCLFLIEKNNLVRRIGPFFYLFLFPPLRLKHPFNRYPLNLVTTPCASCSCNLDRGSAVPPFSLAFCASFPRRPRTDIVTTQSRKVTARLGTPDDFRRQKISTPHLFNDPQSR